MAETPSQRLWQRERTAAAIEQAALRVFVDVGYEGATTEQIAAEAGVSARTFFRYFPHGKDDVMVLEARRPLLALRAALEARPPDEAPLVALRHASSEIVSGDPGPTPGDAAVIYGQIAIDHPDLLARMMGERQMLAESLVPNLAERMGVDPATDPYPRLLAHSAHAATTTAWLTWLENPAVSFLSLFDEMMQALEPAFGAFAPIDRR